MMDRIYAKAQREKLNQDLDELLAMIDDMKDEDFQISRQKILDRLNEWITEGKNADPAKSEAGWDFSKEKAENLFAENDTIRLRPFSGGDKKFYFRIREQYRVLKKNASDETMMSVYWEGTQKPSVFYCVIERVRDHAKLGYVALKDTTKNLWEIAIELDQAHCRQGYGSTATMLLLQQVKEITGKRQFQFLVEVDNISCQSCMKKIKARLAGIHNLAFDTEEDAEMFEENNLELITEHMKTLAGELDIAPRKLLSHVLDYRLDV